MHDALWAGCVAHPDDDDARGVLADYLTTRGDPRGELMALQLLPADPEAAPARRARIRELVTTHAATWLGPLYGHVRGARFDRGLVTRVTLATRGWRTDHTDNTFDHSEYATIREVLRGGASAADYRRLVTSPQLPSLRALAARDDDETHALEQCPAPITHVELPSTEGPSNAFSRALAHCGQRESVTSVAVYSNNVDRLAREPWFSRLTRVTIMQSGVRNGLAWWPRIPPAASLVLGGTGLDTCELAVPWDARVELHRDGTARVSGEWLLQPLDVLAALPRDIVRLEIEDTSEPIADRIRAVVPQHLAVALRGRDGRAGNLTKPP